MSHGTKLITLDISYGPPDVPLNLDVHLSGPISSLNTNIMVNNNSIHTNLGLIHKQINTETGQ